MTEVTTRAAEVDDRVRRRLALVLDVDDMVEATRLAREMRPWFGVAKVGLELYSAVGPDVVAPLREMGYEVFVDLKLHDIPTTVGRAARVLGALGATYVTMHAVGGREMLRAGDQGLREGAAAVDLPEPTSLAVTILTSDAGAPPHILGKRLTAAMEAGCGGLVCAASDLEEARTIAPTMTRVVPGIRLAGDARHDQARPATPGEAAAEGADILVVGRTVTRAIDRAAAASAVAAEVAEAMSQA
ncbi:orotidine-5'-phosphate decarboxylase [Iamia sp. SCSIO 61187]|uniref:orotidine-5'-phosphate decarboxylase n=1 Tax=Iamia sp. SCSIO 61187 TaxID=2722752 RepID=UPI001C62605A|nr:orotidine-5'-phosphate decarboxylase [Iamia sp. SCSIO 61187]QYG93087.1 orotidine-5'-phosphate decarboxylase [Iamia sp. SCSIO 61187]